MFLNLFPSFPLVIVKLILYQEKKTKTKQKDKRIMGPRFPIWFWYQYICSIVWRVGLFISSFLLILFGVDFETGFIVESKLVGNSFVEQAGLPTSSCFFLPPECCYYRYGLLGINEILFLVQKWNRWLKINIWWLLWEIHNVAGLNSLWIWRWSFENWKYLVYTENLFLLSCTLLNLL